MWICSNMPTRPQFADRRTILGTAAAQYQVRRLGLLLEVAADMEQRFGKSLLQRRADIGALLVRTVLAVDP